MPSDFGDYKLLAEIGRGGMGIVYQALDQRNQRLVAIKQLVLTNIDPTKEREFRDRFRREAATAARLHHPNIVDVYDVHMESEEFFYVMEFLDGHSLRTELEKKGGRLSTADYWPILSQVVEGLSFAHSMNVVHRDVKPDNIFLLADGRVKLTDFGIARAADFEQTHLTKTGVMMGTLAYVSPEQLQDAKNVDHRADIFSLGVVSYESLSGILPFTGDGIAQTIVKIISHEEKPLHIVCPQVSLHTSAAVTKAMRKRAKERYRSVVEFCKEFQSSMTESSSNDDEQTTANIPDVMQKYELHVTRADSSGENPEITDLRARASADQSIDTDPNFGLLPREFTGSESAATISPSSAMSNAIADIRKSQPILPIGKPEFTNQQPVLIFDKCGKNQSKLTEPAVLCSHSGRLLVADVATRDVHMFSFDGRWLGNLVVKQNSDTKTGGGAVTKPSGLAVDPKGRIYLIDSSDPYVRVFDSKGNFLKEFINIQGKSGGLQGIAIDSTGLIYVSDLVNGCIQVFQPELGLWMRSLGLKQADQRLQLPSGLGTDRVNQLYCVDYGASKVYIFNKIGNVIRSFGSKGTGPGAFNLPRSVAVDNNDKIYVLDSLNHRVQVFGPTGDYFCSFGGRGSEPGKFIGPADLSFDSINNLLYVADKGNQRVQVFDLSSS